MIHWSKTQLNPTEDSASKKTILILFKFQPSLLQNMLIELRTSRLKYHQNNWKKSKIIKTTTKLTFVRNRSGYWSTWPTKQSVTHMRCMPLSNECCMNFCKIYLMRNPEEIILLESLELQHQLYPELSSFSVCFAFDIPKKVNMSSYQNTEETKCNTAAIFMLQNLFYLPLNSIAAHRCLFYVKTNRSGTVTQ